MVSRPGRARPLVVTGERTLPGIWHENYWFRRHEVAYEFFLGWSRHARVLDVGCGEGYGAARLSAGGAALVVGIDLDRDVMQHVRTAYAAVRAVQGNAVRLPFATASLDVVVGAQVVEHLWDQHAFLSECARSLRPGGHLLLSTPNRLTLPRGNVFHSRELDAGELVAMVAAHLRVDRMLGIAHGPRIGRWSRAHGDPVVAQLATRPEHWPPDLSALVDSVTVGDFVIRRGDLPGALDLVLVATLP